MSAPALQIEDLRVISRDGRVLLNVPSLQVPPGQSLALRGASGAGKSTLLHVLSGLVRPSVGRVIWGSTDLSLLSEDARARFRHHTLGLIFQDGHLFEELSALGNAAVAQAFSLRKDRVQIRYNAQHWLQSLGLGQAGNRPVDSFSGGERQRIAVARAMATGPQVILADEPTAALDRARADALGADLAQLAAEQGCTLITVTHDDALAARMARVISLADGRIVGDSHA